MNLTAPRFWQEKTPMAALWSALLSPLAFFYGAALRRKLAQVQPEKAALPVVCIGNITLGGTGKTPFALTLHDLLAEKSLSPAFLSRGYGGALSGPCLVSEEMTAEQCGDEPLLLAAKGPAVIAKDRVAGAWLIARETTAEVILMDDGFQNPSLSKDISILVIDAIAGIGNGRLFPAGPLRERPEDALRRADAVLFVKPGADFVVPEGLMQLAGAKPAFEGWIRADAGAVPREVFAFAGIGRPAKFFDTLRQAGFTLAGTREFADHHPWKLAELNALKDAANRAGVALITTEKDWQRLPVEWRARIDYLPVTMQLDRPEDLIRLILTRIGVRTGARNETDRI